MVNPRHMYNIHYIKCVCRVNSCVPDGQPDTTRTKVVTSRPVLISRHFYRFRISEVNGQSAKCYQVAELVELLVLIGWRFMVSQQEKVQDSD